MAISDLDLKQLQEMKKHLRAQRSTLPQADRGQANDVSVKAQIDAVEARESILHGEAASEIEAKTGPD